MGNLLIQFQKCCTNHYVLISLHYAVSNLSFFQLKNGFGLERCAVNDCYQVNLWLGLVNIE